MVPRLGDRLGTWRSKLIALLLAFSLLPIGVLSIWQSGVISTVFVQMHSDALTALARAKAGTVEQFMQDRKTEVERIAPILPQDLITLQRTGPSEETPTLKLKADKLSVTMSLEERSRERRKRIVTNRTTSFEEAEAWDLDFWQSMTPEERLSALVAIRRDVELIEEGKVESTEVGG